MAKKEKLPSDLMNDKGINKIMNFINNGLKSVYKDTYQNQRTNNDDLENINNDIDAAISNIAYKDVNGIDASNITRLYTRLDSNRLSKQDENDILDLFNDKSITDAIMTSSMDNKGIVDFDKDIDTILTYMPKLYEALEAKKDSVLSADHFSKEFITVRNKKASIDNSGFSKQIKTINKAYDMNTLVDELYDKTAKYGESFLYVVPYNTALSKLLEVNPNATKSIKRGSKLKSPTVHEMCIIENGKVNNDILNKKDIDASMKSIDNNSNISITLSLDKSGLLESAILEQYRKQDCINTINETYNGGIYESFIQEQALSESSKNIKLSNIIPSELELPEELRKSNSSDGTIDINSKKNNDIKINVPGCIVKILPRENVIPIYVDNLCLGYYYLEFLVKDPYYTDSLINTTNLSHMTNRAMDAEKNKDTQEQLLNNIATTIASKIDANFINANQDLRKEIYMVLKHNDVVRTDGSAANIKVSFLPEPDVIHMAFNRDPNTHRGISDLQRSLLPAKLYACLYITNTIGILTRGNEKRVYYVKQSVDTNISKTMMNVISQIKQSNFGLRQMHSLNNALNLIGRFNDYVIPMNQSGEAPIQFEVMPGQNIEYKTELMQSLEEMAINSTDVPIELIQARQSLDYAIQLSMTNSKFLRCVYKRQAIAEVFLSKLYTKIYNCEYNENEDLEVSLPIPAFLNMTNINQMIENAKQYVQSLCDIELANESDEVKNIFTKKMIRQITCTHVNGSEIDLIKSDSIIEAKTKEGINNINNEEE